MCCTWHGPKLSCTIPTYIFYRTTTQYTLKHGGLHRHIHPHNQAPGMNPATPAASTSSSTMGVCHSAVAIAAAAAQLPIGGRCTADDLQLPLVDCSPRRYTLSHLPIRPQWQAELWARCRCHRALLSIPCLPTGTSNCCQNFEEARHLLKLRERGECPPNPSLDYYAVGNVNKCCFATPRHSKRIAIRNH